MNDTVSLEIRSYINTDTHSLCEVWNAHHAGLVDGSISSLHFELAVLAKPYFVAKDLLVAMDGDVIRGFLHLANGSSADLTETDCKRGVLSALCVTPSSDESEIAARCAASGHQRHRNHTGLDSGLVWPDCWVWQANSIWNDVGR